MQMFYYKNQNRKNSISQNPVFIGSNAGQNTDETMVSSGYKEVDYNETIQKETSDC